MNPSDWRKAATSVTQHKQEAAMAETDQLSSMPLSQIAIDDSGSPIVHYGMHMPVAASTPYRYRHTCAQLTAGRFLLADHPRYPSRFIIPYIFITWLRSSSFRY